MAHVRQHANSPFWYIRRRGFDGKWSEQSTGLRIDNEDETHRAKRMAEKQTIAEKLSGAEKHSDFRSWVPGFLKSRYQHKRPGTQRRVEIAWHTLGVFLQLRDLYHPRQIKYKHAGEYMTWRRNTVVNRCKVGHNTARLEVKFFSLVIDEAVKREYADANPLIKLDIGLAPQKRKKALSDDEIRKARADLREQVGWMADVFEIMLLTGCRFSESAIDFARVNFDNNELTITDSKRNDSDPRKFFTVPMHPSLKPVLARIRSTGAERTVDLTREKNSRFNHFLHKSVGASSHSLRVTFITKCHQAGLSERQAMRLVNHSSKAVHEIYSRLNVDDVREAQARISFPTVLPFDDPAIPSPT